MLTLPPYSFIVFTSVDILDILFIFILKYKYLQKYLYFCTEIIRVTLPCPDFTRLIVDM